MAVDGIYFINSANPIRYEQAKRIVECWGSGVLEDWSAGGLEWWTDGVLEEWSFELARRGGMMEWLARHWREILG